jgi:hypothetical protein
MTMSDKKEPMAGPATPKPVSYPNLTSEELDQVLIDLRVAAEKQRPDSAEKTQRGWGEVPVDKSARPYNHYSTGGVEPIDLIRDLGLLEPFAAANVIKYVARYPKKNGLDDLLKARTYLNWLIEEVEKK